jgi:hypothetical protein
MNPVRRRGPRLPLGAGPWDDWDATTAENQVIVFNDHFELHVSLRDIEGRLRAERVEVVSLEPAVDPVTPQVLLSTPLAIAETIANSSFVEYQIRKTRPAKRETVTVPVERPYPLTFWQSVAFAYNDFAIHAGKSNPAVLIAEEAGVPVATVRSWIARCRELGFLGKGSQGRVG